MTDVRTDGQRKRVFIRTYGCQMNVYDSDRMADVLRPLGYAMADTPEQADLVVLNTCHIRENASEKVYSELGRLRDTKRERRAEGRDLTIAVAGCVAQAEGEEIVRRQPAVDIVVGPAGLSPPARAAGRGRAQGRHPPRRQAPAGRRRARHRFPGREQVRPPAGAAGRARRLGLPVDPGRLRQVLHLLRRALYARRGVFAAGGGGAGARRAQLVAAGALEITLLGQNVNAYHGEARQIGGSTWSLARLIRALAEIDGLARIRYTTSHPRDMDDDLIAAHGECRSSCRSCTCRCSRAPTASSRR